MMDIGIFQLLPRGRAATDREVVEQALWEVDFAERHGFESVWVTEHHFSGYGSIGVPSVSAAGIAQRTRRIRIGYESVRRSVELMANQVIPRYCRG